MAHGCPCFAARNLGHSVPQCPCCFPSLSPCSNNEPACPSLPCCGRWGKPSSAQCKSCPVRSFGLDGGHLAPPDPFWAGWTPEHTDELRDYLPPSAYLGDTASAPSTTAPLPATAQGCLPGAPEDPISFGGSGQSRSSLLSSFPVSHSHQNPF